VLDAPYLDHGPNSVLSLFFSFYHRVSSRIVTQNFVPLAIPIPSTKSKWSNSCNFFSLFPKPNHDAHGSLKSPVQLINVKEMLKMHMNMSQNGAINHEKNIVSFILEELIVSQ